MKIKMTHWCISLKGKAAFYGVKTVYSLQSVHDREQDQFVWGLESIMIAVPSTVNPHLLALNFFPEVMYCRQRPLIPFIIVLDVSARVPSKLTVANSLLQHQRNYPHRLCASRRV